MKTFWKVLKWVVIVIVVAFVGLVIYRTIYFFNLDKTNAQVERIHSTKLTLDDVMGKNLPPDPGAEADKTISGVDANQNGIRDDVELAVFKEYPNSAKTRAVLLQYALALQMQTTQSFLNTNLVTEIVREEDRAYSCIGEIASRNDLDLFMQKVNKLESFVKDKQFNTQERIDFRKEFYKKIDSYASLERVCDIDYSKLKN